MATSEIHSQPTGAVLRKALTRSKLHAAWQKVRGNNGCAGVDGVSLDKFSIGLQARLDGLRSAVLGGHYVAQPLLRLWLPSREGKSPRALSVPCVADRVLQTSLAMVLQPLFEAEFEDCSFAYRQGRSVRQAVERIATLQRQGYRWVVDGDIAAFFDQIPHSALLDEVREVVRDESVVWLMSHWLTLPVAVDGVLGPPSTIGVAQGSPLSPMLANLYLDHLDEALLREDLALVRYADDFVILTRTESQAQVALELTERTLRDLQLKLNDHKTRIVHLDAGMDFLGWTFVRSMAVPRARGVAPESSPAPLPMAPHKPTPATVGPDDDGGPLERVSLAAITPSAVSEHQGALPDADVLQRTLYVVEPGCELGKESERLQLRKGDAVLLEAPVIHVDQVVLFGQHAMTPAAMYLCMAHRVPVVLLSRLGRFVGRLDAPDCSHSALLLAQVNGLQDEVFRLALAQQLVAAKLDHSALVLARYSRRHAPAADGGERLHNTILQLREDRRRVKTASSLDSLRGLEGQAARAYFDGMRLLLGSEWGFTARLKRPPPDPVNAMLSLGYTLLYHSVAGLLQARGLNAHLGLFHSSSGGHFALASDVMEEFRSVVVDGLVLDWCLNGLVSPGDFKVHSDGCSLSPDTTRRFIHAYEDKLGSASAWIDPAQGGVPKDLRQRIDHQAMRLCQALHARDPLRYKPSDYR